MGHEMEHPIAVTIQSVYLHLRKAPKDEYTGNLFRDRTVSSHEEARKGSSRSQNTWPPRAKRRALMIGNKTRKIENSGARKVSTAQTTNTLSCT